MRSGEDLADASWDIRYGTRSRAKPAQAAQTDRGTAHASAHERRVSWALGRRMSDVVPNDMIVLNAVFRRAVELGLSDDEAVGRMKENVRTGQFSAKHYTDLWGLRILEN